MCISKRVHFKEMLTLAGNGEAATTLDKGLMLPLGSHQMGPGDLSVLNPDWVMGMYPSPILV